MTKTELANKDTFGADAWIARISELELPAVTATAGKLEDLARQDTSTLGQIGKAVLHDTALTSQVLRVANSAVYNPSRRDISTVSRAAIVLGFQTIRSICITSKLLNSLLDRGTLSAAVHDRLLRLLANSLHAAVQARSLVGAADDETLEQVFITALLSDLGACAFWSMGGEETEQLDGRLKSAETPDGNIIDDFLGTSFNAISIGLARNWKLGSLLVQSLDTASVDNRNVDAVRLAREISFSVAESGWDSPATVELVARAASMLGVTETEARKRLLENARETTKLAACYGASALDRYLPARSAGVALSKPAVVTAVREADESLQLRVLRELTAMMSEKPDFNQVIHTAMEGIHRGIGADRTITGLINPQQRTVAARFVLGEASESWTAGFKFPLGQRNNLFDRALNANAPAWFDAVNADANRHNLGEELARFCQLRGCMIAPVSIARRPVAFLYADRAPSKRELQPEDFASFSHFAQQVTLCLSMINRQRG